MYITCNRCNDAHEVVMPPILATQFTAHCPYCNAVTMHRKSTYMEVEVCKQNESEMLED